ncbi:MAG: ABC transporter substrate-binding protein [Deltaproteobacteria bacterium]|nr:ABC transporter substrate-binding protein [Deltaproteobacteria bacterium]
MRIVAAVLYSSIWLFPAMVRAQNLEPIHVALTTRSFQYVIFPLAQERGYLKEEGIDLRIVMMQTTPGLQALVSGQIQFSGAGSSALVAIAKGNAPLKTVLAVNDKVHQWMVGRPGVTTIKDLKGKKLGVTGLASAAVFMFRQLAPKQGVDPNKDITYITMPTGNRLAMLQSGVIDAMIVGNEDRYPALDQGNKEILYFGNEVKNSWGTVATSDRFLKEQPKLAAGFMRATLKGLRVLRRDKEAAVASFTRFTKQPRSIAARMYDDLINTFTANGAVDEEIQRNDLAIIQQIADVKEPVPLSRAYDFSLALEADQQLTRANWRP